MNLTADRNGGAIERCDAGGILAVDDDPKNLLALEVALGDLASNLVTASSGEQALRLVLESDFAVILLDVQMPTIDGFETARLIRSRARSRHIPIIFITAFNQDDREIRRGYELGAVDFLFKPIVPDVLRAKVQVFVELRLRTHEVAIQAERLRAMEREEGERRLTEARQAWEAEQLRKENQQLAENDRRKDDFIAMLAHELRNPLAPLLASVELLNMATFEDDVLVRARGAMGRQVRHLTRLVDDLLDVSRISQGKLELAKEIVDLGQMVDHAVETSRPGIESREQVLLIHRTDAPIYVEADPVRLTQVIANLLNNASRYTDEGGQIEIAWSTARNTASFRIRDTGRGIDPELLPRIFDMFVQEREGGKGLGLGLTLVKKVVELHEGSVLANSDGPGKGSEFVLTLPLANDRKPPVVVEATRTPREDSPLRVAIVDDDEDIRYTVQGLLERWGHEVLIADSGIAGVELIVRTRPDVALLDIGLPGLDGYGVAQRVHSELGHARPRLIAVTGYGQERDQQRASQAGFDAFLVKPAEPEQLRELLRTLS